MKLGEGQYTVVQYTVVILSILDQEGPIYKSPCLSDEDTNSIPTDHANPHNLQPIR